MIKFGTDGWRALIAEEFTYDNVRVVSQAVADFIKAKNKQDEGYVVGYDNRFLSEEFARIAAEVLVSNNIKTYLCVDAVPTPVLSYAVVEKKAFGGVMITASHNPYNYNGYKIKMHCGSSATEDITTAIETNVGVSDVVINPTFFSNIERINLRKSYIDYVKSKVDFETIKKANFKIVVDCLYGPGMTYVTEILKDTGIEVTEVNGYRDAFFGGINPEPLAVNTPELISKMKNEKKWRIGFVLDGDADRLGVVDGAGKFLSAQETFVLLVKYIYDVKGLKGPLAKAYNMTRMLEKLSAKYDYKMFETKIGFKYLADHLIKGDVILAGEESGGYGSVLHIPERDGVFNTLLLCELLAKTGLGPREMLNEIMDEIGYYYYDRIDAHIVDNETKEQIIKDLETKAYTTFCGRKVVEKKKFDGIKFFLENDEWILFRKSGTESLLRVYAEGRTEDSVKDLLAEGQRFVKAYF
jgi:phosphomannomutase